MATEKMLTDTEIEKRLIAARDAEKRARVRVAVLKRGLRGATRRAETQRLCTLGRVLMTWCERDERVMYACRRYLADYITRDTDREILRNTRWEVAAPHAAEPSDG